MRFLVFLFLLPLIGLSQASPQTTYTVTGMTGLRTYFGYSSRVFVDSTNESYVICNSCNSTDVGVVSGAGGRKWILDNFNGTNRQNYFIFIQGDSVKDIQTVLDTLSFGATLVLKRGQIYPQNRTLRIRDNSVKILTPGGSSIKRLPATIVTTTRAASSTDNFMVISGFPATVEVGATMEIFVDSGSTTAANSPATIASIGHDTIFFTTTIGNDAGGSPRTWPIGSRVEVVYDQISCLTNTVYEIEGLTIDGNKWHNNYTHYYGVNSAVSGRGRATFTRCTFQSIPNECFNGSTFFIRNCYATGLNGSFLHMTSSIATPAYYQYGEITGTTVDSCNLVSNSLTGHSEAMITFSANAGRFKVYGNWFRYGGEAVFGTIKGGTSTLGASRDFIFSNNFCRRFKNICSGFSVASTDTPPRNIVIINNQFDSCGSNDWSSGIYATGLTYSDTLLFTDNKVTGNTIWINIPIKHKINQSVSYDVPIEYVSDLSNQFTANQAVSKAYVDVSTITAPIRYGGSGAGSTLTLQSTSGVGTTDAVYIKVGNNGAVNAQAAISNGSVGWGTTSPGIASTGIKYDFQRATTVGLRLQSIGTTAFSTFQDYTGIAIFTANGYHSDGGSFVQADVTKPSWFFYLDPISDNFTVNRKAAGGALTQPFIVTATTTTLFGKTKAPVFSLPNTGGAATAGTATLVGGTVTVNTTAMTATALLFYNPKTAGGTIGTYTYTQVNGTSFTINSSSGTDTSTLVWEITETH